MSNDIDRLDSYVQGIGGINEAARKLGVNRSTVHRWIIGEQPIPGLMMAVLKVSDKLYELHQENCALEATLKLSELQEK